MEPSITNPQPIVITCNTFKQSPVQLRDDVFCSDCEKLFNSGGESWMHRHIATSTGFKLFDLFTRHAPLVNEPDITVYDAAKIPGVDCAAMLEYGTGVFFKSAAHTWKFEDGTSTHIDLGPDRTEALRKFAHREGPFPADMVLTVCLSTKSKQFLGVIPPLQMQVNGTEEERYYFHVPGVYYCLLIGTGIDTGMKTVAFNQPVVKPVFVGDEWADQALGIMKHLARGITPSPKLKQGLKPKNVTNTHANGSSEEESRSS